MTSPYRVIKDQCYNSWKHVPTIISGRDSDLIGVRLPQTQDAWEERCNTNWRDDTVDSREMNYEVISVNKSSSLIQGEDKEVADELSDNSSKFPKDGFPQLCEQGDNICQIKMIYWCMLEENIHNLTMVERCTQNMGWVARPTLEWWFSNQ